MTLSIFLVIKIEKTFYPEISARDNFQDGKIVMGTQNCHGEKIKHCPKYVCVSVPIIVIVKYFFLSLFNPFWKNFFFKTYT